MIKRRVTRIIFAAAGILLVLNAIAAGAISSFHIGVIAELCIGAALMLYAWQWTRLTRLRPLNVIVITLLAAVTLSVLFLFVYGHSRTVSYDEDAVIVLGAGLRGEAVSTPLARRLIAAMRYHERNPDAVIVATGGQGRNEAIPEAEAEARWLIRRGVPEELIIREDRSTSTAQNLEFAKTLLDSRFPEGCRVVIISNAFHVFRARQIALRLGLDAAVLGAGDGVVLTIPGYLRELAALAAMYLLGYDTAK